MALIPQVEKGGQSLGRGQHDIASVASVTAVRPSARDEHLAAEAAAPVAAATGLDCNGDFVDEHRMSLLIR
jgi:hypothetical protein